MAERGKAKITITAEDKGVERTLKVVAELEKRIKQLEAQLRSYDKASKMSEMQEERLRALRYKNATAIDAVLKKERDTIAARTKIASATTDLALKEERLSKLRYARSTQLDASVAKWLKEETAINRAAIAENQAAASVVRLGTAKNQQAASVQRITVAQQQANAATFRAITANTQSQIAVTKLGTAQNQQAASAQRVVVAQNQAAASVARVATAQNQTAASAARVVTAQNQAAASAARVTTAQNQAQMSTMRLQQMQNRAAAATEHHTKTWTQHIATVAGGILVYQGIRTAMHGVLSIITGGVKAVSDYQDAVIGAAAMYTTLAKDQGNIPETYAKNKQYAEQLIPVLQQIDRYSSMNLSELLQMNQALAIQGTAMNLSSKEQIQGYTNISNAIKFVTRGQATSRQIMQETKTIITGTAKSSDQLGLILKTKIGPEYEKQIAQWRKIGQEIGDSGYVIAKIGEKLSGYTAASKDMENTWTAVYSGLSTTFDIVARESMTDVLADWVKYIKQFNDYLRDHKKEIASAIKGAWEQMKNLGKTIYENWDKVKLVLEAIIAAKIIEGWLALVKVMTDAKIAARALAVVMGTDLVIATGGLGAVFIGIMLVIDQLLDKTSWLNDRFETLSNTIKGFNLARQGAIGWLDYANSSPEQLAKLIKQQEKAKLYSSNTVISANGATPKAKDKITGNLSDYLLSNRKNVEKQDKPQDMLPPVDNDSKDRNRAAREAESRARMLLKWNNELERTIATQYRLNDVTAVYGKLQEYNDRLKEKGYATLTPLEKEELVRKLMLAEHAKKVSSAYNKYYDDVTKAEEDWQVATEAVNKLLENQLISQEKQVVLTRKINEERNRSKYALYDTTAASMSAVYEQQLSDLKDLKDAQFITEQQYNDRVVLARIDATKKLLALDNSTYGIMNQAVMQWSDSWASTMTDMIFNAETSFSGIVESFGRMLVQMYVQKKIFEPILGSLFSGVSGVSTSTGNVTGTVVGTETGFGGYSAAGGFDIPSGLNPVTQLHEKEMVLPAEYAEKIRNLDSGGVQNITIELVNKGGDDVKLNGQSSRMEGDRLIVTAVMEAVQKNKYGARDFFKSM